MSSLLKKTIRWKIFAYKRVVILILKILCCDFFKKRRKARILLEIIGSKGKITSLEESLSYFTLDGGI